MSEQQLIHGALYFLKSSEVVVRADMLMDGAFLGVVTKRDGRFYASLCRTTPFGFEHSFHSIAPCYWSSHAIDQVLCGSAADGWLVVERALSSLTVARA